MTVPAKLGPALLAAEGGIVIVIALPAPVAVIMAEVMLDFMPDIMAEFMAPPVAELAAGLLPPAAAGTGNMAAAA